MNLPDIRIMRTARHRFGEETYGIYLSRFGASWLIAGGKRNDRDGFITWMMNIPFQDHGKTIFISQDDAEDAYWMMSTGKLELETNARQFIKKQGLDERGYVIIKELEE